MKKGAVEIPRTKLKEIKETLIVLSVVCLFGLGGIALFFILDARGKIVREDRLDAHGVTTKGQIDTTSRARNTYYIHYIFNAQGRTYSHRSQVDFLDYTTAASGQPIRVTYLPNEPDISRAAPTIIRHEAEVEWAYALLLAAIGLFLPVGYFLYMKQEEQQQSARQTIDPGL